jgi:hypothetical protein
MDVSALHVHDHIIIAQTYNRYWVSPFTYIIEGLLGQGAASFPIHQTYAYWLFLALGHQTIVCAATELVTLIPPSGQTCGTYLQDYINRAGGYVQDPSSTSSCQICSFATTDQLLAARFHIFYSHRWRNVGIMIAYTFANVSIQVFYQSWNVHQSLLVTDRAALHFNVYVPYQDWKYARFVEKTFLLEALVRVQGFSTGVNSFCMNSTY